MVGESGSGKCTLARLVMALEPPTAGQVRLDGQDLHALAPAALRARAREAADGVPGPLRLARPAPHRAADGGRAAGACCTARRRPSSASAPPRRWTRWACAPPTWPSTRTNSRGGQRQRIAIARALITRPKLIVADEPVSALDVSVQAQVLNLMQDLQDRFGVTYLFISHDLAVVDLVCDEVIVLYQGRIVERGAPDTLFQRAAHPYTRALLEAVPRLQPGARRAAARRRLPRGLGRGAGRRLRLRAALRLRQRALPRERPLLRELAAARRTRRPATCRDVAALPAGAGLSNDAECHRPPPTDPKENTMTLQRRTLNLLLAAALAAGRRLGLRRPGAGAQGQRWCWAWCWSHAGPGPDHRRRPRPSARSCTTTSSKA